MIAGLTDAVGWNWREFSTRCRQLLASDGSEYVDDMDGATVRCIRFNDSEYTIFINTINDAMSVSLQCGDSLSNLLYRDERPGGQPCTWIGDKIYDIAIPMLRRRMVLDDLAGAC